MKTTLFTISLIVGVVSLCHEGAAATPKHRLSHGTVFTYRHHAVETNAPLIELKPQVTGVIRVSFGMAIRCRCLIHSRRQNMEPLKRTLSLIRMFPDEEMVSSFSAFRSSQVDQRRNLRLANLRSGCNSPPRALPLKRNFELGWWRNIGRIWKATMSL